MMTCRAWHFFPIFRSGEHRVGTEDLSMGCFRNERPFLEGIPGRASQPSQAAFPAWIAELARGNLSSAFYHISGQVLDDTQNRSTRSQCVVLDPRRDGGADC
jgi:hypothetical protein